MKKLLLLFSIFLSLTAQAATTVTLSWDANPAAEKVTSYKVYEHTGANYNLLGTVLSTADRTFIVTDPDPAIAHNYALSAVNLRGESAKSADTVLPIGAGIPKNLKITVTITVP